MRQLRTNKLVGLLCSPLEGDPLCPSAPVEAAIHACLHNNMESFTLSGKVIQVQTGQYNKRYIQYGNVTYERATRNSPGESGRYVQRGYEVTICITTGQPWRILLNGHTP